MSNTIDEQLVQNFSVQHLKEAYENYKKRKTDYFDPDEISIPMGADGVTFDAFEKELERNFSNISNRIATGTYTFYPFREVDIPKSGGGIRTLSIASIRDVLVQQQLYFTIYPTIERLFKKPSIDRVSFAYRKGRSGPQAALYLSDYINSGYCFALDADVVKYFDRIPHDDLLNVIAKYIDPETLTYKLLRRFILVDRVPFNTYRKRRFKRLKGKEIFRKVKPDRKQRTKGVPQGGTLSGMLANLYLNQFDVWVMEELGRETDLKYVRYADDFVILVKNEVSLAVVHERVREKLNDIGLELHTDPSKTRLVNILKEGIDFVGFHFTGSTISIRERNIESFKERFQKKLRSDLEWNYKFKNVEQRLKLLILQKLNYKIYGVQTTCSVCFERIEKKPKSWISYFSISTDTKQLRDLDKWVRAQIAMHFWKNYSYRVERKRLRMYLASLEQEYYKLRKGGICCCKPITEEDFIDYFYE